MDEKINFHKQIVTFCAISVLFLGSLYYFVSTAFDTRDILLEKQAQRNSIKY